MSELSFNVSHSKLRTFRTCRQQYKYKYVDKLRPKRKARALYQGSWIHQLLEAYYDPKQKWRRVNRRLKKEFNKLLDEEKDYYGDLPGDCKYLMKEYEKEYGREKALINEYVFENIEIHKDIFLNGRIDLIIENDKGVWIVEHKTTQRFPNEQDRFMNPQMALYIPIVREVLGIEVTGVLWNYIRTKIPKTKKAQLMMRRYMPINETLVNQLWQETEVTAIEAKLLNHYYRNLSPMICRMCEYSSLCFAELAGSDTRFIRENEFEIREKEDSNGEEQNAESESK